MKIRRFEVLQTALPFRSAFSHARFSRMHSASVFVRCELEDGTVGFGEGLPREYVTGETWDGCFRCLAEQALPALSDLDFVSHEEMERFCEGLYGYLRQAAPGMPAHYGAACCAAELALLDAYGKHFGRSVFSGATDSDPVYSGVVSSSSLLKAAAVCWLCRRHDLPAVKLKVGAAHDGRLAWLSRAILGRKASLRADANMAWSADRALEAIRRLQRHGVQWIEQPLAVGNPADWRLLHRETGASLIADESLRDEADARSLIAAEACQAFNLRISKCGGFFQSLRLGRIARENGIGIQVGCQVGESALLSAAGLALARRLSPVLFAEGCFGEMLLAEDVLEPRQHSAAAPFVFGHGGKAPFYRPVAGIGIAIDETRLRRHAKASRTVEHSRGGGA